MKSIQERKIKREHIKSENGSNSWEIEIIFPKEFNIFQHAASMARLEFGCVSQHEKALLARIRK